MHIWLSIAAGHNICHCGLTILVRGPVRMVYHISLLGTCVDYQGFHIARPDSVFA